MDQKDVKNQVGKKAAEVGATAIGGPVAGAAMKKIGDSNIVGGTAKLGKNPATMKNNAQINSNKGGTNNVSSSNSAPTSSGSAPNSSGSAPSNSMNLANGAKSIGKSLGANALANSIDSDSKTGQAINTAKDIQNKVQKAKIWIKILPVIAPVIGWFLLILICILVVMGFILGPGDTVIQFFRDGWENLKTLVGYKDEEYWETKYYTKLDEVQEWINEKYGVCIDINMVTATLSVDMGTDEHVEEGQEDADVEEAELPTESYSEEQYRRMFKQIELVSNMQVRRKIYGFDERQKEANKGKEAEIMARLGADEFTAPNGNYCDYESRIYAVGSVDEEHDHEYFTLKPTANRFSFGKVFNDLYEMFSLTFAGIPIRNSNTTRKIASNDVETGLFTFLNKKANRERNIEYLFYVPAYSVSKVVKSDGRVVKVASCNTSLPVGENAENDYARLDIGSLNKMDGGDSDTNGNVYYWNLIDQFIDDYYADYLDEWDTETLGFIPIDNPRYEKIKNIASDIYLLYNEMGPSRMCEQVDCVDLDLEGEGQGPSDEIENFIEELDESAVCPNGIEVKTNGVSELISFEEYVAGVVAAENNWHQGDSIENLKAQAIAARTYALSATNNCTKSIKNGQSAQVFQRTTDPYVLRAVAETQGMVLTRYGGIFSTQYDALAYESEDGVYVTLSQQGQEIPLSWFDEAGNEICKADLNAARKGKLGSHGNGMSQCGARYLDSIGYTYDQILQYYYGSNAVITMTQEIDTSKMPGIGDGDRKVIRTGNGESIMPTCDYAESIGITGESPEGDFEPIEDVKAGCVDTSQNYWSSSSYNSYTEDFKGQCTWYAFGRSMKALTENAGMTREQAKTYLVESFMKSDGHYVSNNGGEWYKNGASNGLKSTKDINKIQSGSIISWTGGAKGYGHVGFVESVEYDASGNVTSVTVSERNDTKCGANGASVTKYTPAQIQRHWNEDFAGAVVIVDSE